MGVHQTVMPNVPHQFRNVCRVFKIHLKGYNTHLHPKNADELCYTIVEEGTGESGIYAKSELEVVP